MISSPENIHDVAKAIQLAVGPVFLLTGIAGMLNVMAGRLARIVDRGRALTEGRSDPLVLSLEEIREELRGLDRRRHLAGAAITACTLSAFLLCTVIAALFLEVMLEAHLSGLIAVLFTGATMALVVGLAFFLREVNLASRFLRLPFR